MADKDINPKANAFIDQDALTADVHPDAVPFIDQDQVKALEQFAKTPGISEGQAAIEGLSAAPTEGLSSRLGALMGVGLEKGSQALGMGPQAGNAAAGLPTQSVSDLYNEYLAANRKRLESAKKEHPVEFGATQLAGGMALPWSKIIGPAAKLAPTASRVEQLAQAGLQGGKMGAVIGAANAPDYTNIPQTLESTGLGIAAGVPTGVGVNAIQQALVGSAGAAGAGLKGVVGPVGQRFEQGQEAFQAGEPSLATEEGLEKAKQEVSKPVKQTINDLQDILKKSIAAKPKAVAEAGAKFGNLPQDKVDQFYTDSIDKIQTALEKTSDQATTDELNDLLDKFTTAKEGRLQPMTQRIYQPGMKPPPVNPGPQAVSPDVLPPETAPQAQSQQTPEVGQQPPTPLPQLGQRPMGNAPAVRSPVSPDTVPIYPEQGAVGVEGQPSPPSPSGFGGFKKVFSTTIDKNDKEALQAFHQKVMEREAEERVLPGATDQEPIEVVPEPIDGYPDKIRLVARRPIVQQAGDEFKEQASNLVDQQKQSQQQQSIMDQQQQDALKQQQQQDLDLLRRSGQPYFEDITTQGRPGGRDLTNPETFGGLVQDLQNRNVFGEKAYQIPTNRSLVGELAGQANDILTEHSPEIQAANTKINAVNNIFESLGLNPKKLLYGGGEGQQEFVKEIQNFFNLIKPETNTPQSLIDAITNPDRMQYITEQLQRIDPQMAEKFSQTMDKQQATMELIRDFQKPYAGWSLKSVVNALRTFGPKTAYQTGYALEREKAGLQNVDTSRLSPFRPAGSSQDIIQEGQRVFPSFSSQSLQSGAQKAAQDPNPVAQRFSQVLSNLANADERTKNAMLFVLQQNYGYKAMMDKFLPQEEETTPQKKNMELQKFK